MPLKGNGSSADAGKSETGVGNQASKPPAAGTRIATAVKAVTKAILAGIMVAIVRIWSPPYEDHRLGGTLYGPVSICNDLRKLGATADLLFFADEKKGASWHPDFKRLSRRDCKTLNTYDFVIFSTPGSMTDREEGAWWKPILEGLEIPFAVQIHDEDEKKYLPHRQIFFDRPQCKLLLPITMGIAEEMVGNLNGRDLIVYPNFSVLDAPDPSIFYDGKVDQVITTCRMTSRKRVVEFVQQSESLNNAGFAVDVFGPASTWQYKKQLDQLQNQYWTYRGPFRREDLSAIMGPAKFHYNVVSLKRRRFIPRLEVATVEALEHGCCPILAKDSTPSWVTDDMAILVNPNDMNDLADRLTAVRDKAPEMNSAFYNEFLKVNNPDRLYQLAEVITAHASRVGKDPAGPAEEFSLDELPLIEEPAPPQAPADPALSAGNGEGSQDSCARTNDQVVAKPQAPKKFDARRYDRRNTDFAEKVGGKKKLGHTPVKRPENHWWVMANPTITWEPGMYEDKDNNVLYLVDPEFYYIFGNRLIFRTLFLAVNSQGVVFWWPVNTDNLENSWCSSALEAVQEARKGWIRIEANRGAGAYDYYIPAGVIPEPVWPDEDPNTLLERAFTGRIIDRQDHPIIQHILGITA